MNSDAGIIIHSLLIFDDFEPRFSYKNRKASVIIRVIIYFMQRRPDKWFTSLR